jgi:hypothetical protein
MAATTVINVYTGAGPTATSAESGGITFGRDDDKLSGTPVPRPTTTNHTAYSWYKTFALYVSSGGGSTAISNRDIYMGSSATSGLYLYFKNGTATYTQATSGNKPTDGTTTEGEAPSTYTAMTTSPQVFDADSANATNTTINGDYVLVVAGVGESFAGGAGDASLPDLKFDYDES